MYARSVVVPGLNVRYTPWVPGGAGVLGACSTMVGSTTDTRHVALSLPAKGGGSARRSTNVSPTVNRAVPRLSSSVTSSGETRRGGVGVGAGTPPCTATLVLAEAGALVPLGGTAPRVRIAIGVDPYETAVVLDVCTGLAGSGVPDESVIAPDLEFAHAATTMNAAATHAAPRNVDHSRLSSIPPR